MDPEKWITECTYWHLLNTLTQPLDPPVLLVRGVQFRYNKLNTAVFGAFYTLDGHADLTAGKPADYDIVAYDANGTALATYPFNPMWRLPDTKEDRNLIAFGYRIPLTPTLARVDVVGPSSTVLASQQLSASAPTVHVAVEFIRPNTVQPHNGTVHVTWTAQPNNAATLSSVLYSSDNGKTWIDRVFETNAKSFDVLLEPHVRKHQVKIVVTDGTRSSSQVVRFSTP